MRSIVNLGCLLALIACEDSARNRGRIDSESHWLRACRADVDCEGALSCQAGLCSKPCTPGGEDCAVLGDNAVCETLPGTAVVACTLPCDDSAACGGDHLVCDDAVCGPRPEASDVDASGAGTDAGHPASDSGDPAPDAARFVDARPAVDLAFADAAAPAPDAPAVDAAPADANPVDAAAPDSCTDERDCGGARCVGEGRDAQDQLCGAPEPARNVCLPDVCVVDADCGDFGLRCVHAGEYGYVRSACVPAACGADVDCAGIQGGHCLGFFTPCHVFGFACAGDADVCRTDADCPPRGGPRVCEPLEGGGTVCTPISQ